MTDLRFTLEAEDQDEPVDAGDFSVFLASVLDCLRALEGETNAQAPVAYKVVDLKIGSAGIELRPASSGDLDRSAEQVAESFEMGFNALKEDAIRAAPFSRATKRKFLALTKPLRRTTTRIRFAGSSGEVTLSRRTPLRDLPDVRTEAVARGSLTGNVDALNVHRRPVFYIYPPSGPTKVKCTFDPAMLDQLREAIKRNTTVTGLLEYSSGSAFPTRMHVEQVEVNPPDSELPSMASMWGAAPSLTAGRSVREHLESLRDE